MRKCLKAMLLAVFVLIAMSSKAREYPVFGAIFEIKEEDGRMSFIKSAARVDWEKINKGIKDDAENIISDWKGLNLEVPNIDKVVFKDPSTTAKRDIKAPITRNGKIEWHPFIKEGTSINPLDYMEPVQQRVYFNANDYEQIQFVKEMVQAYSRPIELVAVDGDIGKAAKEIEMMVYRSEEQQLAIMGIEFVPSVVSFINKDDQMKIQITSLARPFSIDKLNELIK